MFRQNGVTQVTDEELKEIFMIVDKDGSGALSLNEFKRFISDPKAQHDFKIVAKRI